ncbi:MAG TPA: PAAR domain-containing protein [Pseudomonas sp.]|uniref:PAAR domain-containing protein n=1 Tax=Pseudomonas sp. TaxID=306 RepID=UPI002C8A696F|nr:PAAR domain-containing protein [Pseudomonas sp.]HTO19181.1 PAAR domain-containing protein [Pseudomonas sp.]
MAGKPAARKTDPISCPIPGHGANTIAMGSPDVLINGLPAARQGDTTDCGGVLSDLLSTTVFINGKPAVIAGSLHSHGGVVFGGSGDVLIGDVVTSSPAALSVQTSQEEWIGFSIAAPESYEGLSCIAHFDDGTSLQGVFGADNKVKFSPTGRICQRLEFCASPEQESSSVMGLLLGKITG